MGTKRDKWHIFKSLQIQSWHVMINSKTCWSFHLHENQLAFVSRQITSGKQSIPCGLAQELPTAFSSLDRPVHHKPFPRLLLQCRHKCLWERPGGRCFRETREPQRAADGREHEGVSCHSITLIVMRQERMQCKVNVFHICSCQCWVHAVLAQNSAFPLSKVEADLVWTSLNHIHCIIIYIYIYHNTYVYISIYIYYFFIIINISIHILNDPQRHMVQLLSGGQWITALDLLQQMQWPGCKNRHNLDQ